MSDTSSDNLLHYYKRELAYLREEGAAFAQRYPKIANGLALDGNASRDPHVERLLEGTAFLAARVHRDLDQSFPEIAAALLDNVCPSLTQPVPSMTVVQLDLDPDQGKATAGFRVPRHTSLAARAMDDRICRFRTAWDTTLWPVRVIAARAHGTNALCLTLETFAGTDFSELSIDSLRFHLHGDWTETIPHYESLVSSLQRIDVIPSQGRAACALGADALHELGYGDDESVLAPPEHAYLPYVLLQEYFAFPRKFQFFDLRLPQGVLGTGNRAEIVFVLDAPLRMMSSLRASHFMLGCVPAVNLFRRTSEPIALNDQHYEYRLVADRQREATSEIYRIESVSVIDTVRERSVNIAPMTGGADQRSAAAARMRSPATGANPAASTYAATSAYSASGAAEANAQDAANPDAAMFWMARRDHSLRPDLTGTDLFLSFIDCNNQPRTPDATTVYAEVLCTNRRMAEHVGRDTAMVLENGVRNVVARCLYSPTPQQDPPLDSATLWRLVSLLTLNYESLVSEPRSAAWLQDMLSLFAGANGAHQKQIRGIRSVTTGEASARIGAEAWRGFCRGTDIVLRLDEDHFVGNSPLLLGAVLSRFFAMYTTVNSFVRLSVQRRDETWKKWPAMSGLQTLL